MATESGDGLSPHLRGVTVTTIATLFGMGAGVAAAIMADGPADSFGLMLLGAAVLVQLPLFRLFGVDVSEFGTKDHLYVTFMTFVLWFITWGLALTTGAF